MVCHQVFWTSSLSLFLFISNDFTKFGVEVMLSGVALSLAEGILKEPEE